MDSLPGQVKFSRSRGIAQDQNGDFPMIASLLPLGPFIVENSGKLSFKPPGSQACFNFSWRGRRISAELKGGEISLNTVIGRVPSSGAGAAARARVLAASRSLARAMPAGFALTLTADHRIAIASRQGLDWPATSGALMAPLVAFALRLSPYLDLFEEAGV
jgi:hypothetical protein